MNSKKHIVEHINKSDQLNAQNRMNTGNRQNNPQRDCFHCRTNILCDYQANLNIRKISKKQKY